MLPNSAMWISFAEMSLPRAWLLPPLGAGLPTGKFSLLTNYLCFLKIFPKRTWRHRMNLAIRSSLRVSPIETDNLAQAGELLEVSSCYERINSAPRVTLGGCRRDDDCRSTENHHKGRSEILGTLTFRLAGRQDASS